MSERKLLIHETMIHMARQIAMAAKIAVGTFEPSETLHDHVEIMVSHPSFPEGDEPLTIVFGHAWNGPICCLTAFIGSPMDIGRLAAANAAKSAAPEATEAEERIAPCK